MRGTTIDKIIARVIASQRQVAMQATIASASCERQVSRNMGDIWGAKQQKQDEWDAANRCRVASPVITGGPLISGER